MALINKKQEYQDQEDWSDSIEKLKRYKELKEKVEYWAKQENPFNQIIIQGPYEIVWDNELGWCVDVNGNVIFYGSNIKEIPFQFRNVSGYFSCCDCKNLTSLKGSPIYVKDDVFDCERCPKLTSLEGCPKEVGGNFYCGECGKKFTKEYVKSLCNVKGEIWV